MGSYTVVDLLSFYKINYKVRLNLDVKNVFDRDYEEGAFGNVYAYPAHGILGETLFNPWPVRRNWLASAVIRPITGGAC